MKVLMLDRLSSPENRYRQRKQFDVPLYEHDQRQSDLSKRQQRRTKVREEANKGNLVKDIKNRRKRIFLRAMNWSTTLRESLNAKINS